MSLEKYQAFIKVIEYQSFTKAGEVLNYSQSGISRMIKDLEEDFSAPLLHRSRNGVSLTSTGEMLLPYIKNLCEAHERLLEKAMALEGLKGGLIRIGTFSSVATHWLGAIISEFQKDYPEIDYELLVGDYKEIEEWTLSGRVDFGFVRLPVSKDLETIFLEADEMRAILPKKHPLAEKSALRAEDFSGEPFLLLEKGAKAEVIDFFKEAGVSPEIKFTTWDDYAIMSMVEKNLGVSVLPSLILRRIPYDILTRPLEPVLSRKIGVALKSYEGASLAVKTFLKYLGYRKD